MVYINIIEQSLVNNTFTYLFKIVNVKDSSDIGECQNHEFKKLEFHKLSNFIINEIKVEIRNPEDELVMFKNNNVELNLLFASTKKTI